MNPTRTPFFVTSALEFMMDKHRSLRNDYRAPGSRYSDSCGLVALEVAQKLIAEGMQPAIFQVCSSSLPASSGKEYLAPLLFEGRVLWGNHQVCCAHGLAYDPLLVVPVPVSEYTRLLFGEALPMNVLINEEATPEFCRRAVTDD